MKCRKYLDDARERIGYQLEYLDQDKERLETLQTDLECLSAISGGDRVQTSSNFDKIGSMLSRIEELEKTIKEREKRLENTRQGVIKEIEKINDIVLEEVLVERYVYGKSDVEIALQVGITDRGIRKRAVKALGELEKVFKNS